MRQGLIRFFWSAFFLSRFFYPVTLFSQATLPRTRLTAMKRRLYDSDEFVPNKRRKLDTEAEKLLIDELKKDISTDEECTANEETLLVSEDEEQLRQLIDRLPDLNQRFGYVKQTPLMVAIENGMTELAKYLIQEKKVDLTVQDDNLQTALHYACENGDDDVAVLIIDMKKQDHEYLDMSDGDAITPLIYAVRRSCVNAVAKLFALKVTWTYKYDEGESVHAVLEARDKETVRQFQGDPSKYWGYVEKHRNKLVHKAVENSNLELLEEFLPQYSLDNYFATEEDSGEVDSWDEVEDEGGNILAKVIEACNEELLRYLHDRKAWFRDLGHVAVDTDDMNTIKLMQEFNGLCGSKKSMQNALDAAVDNENYEVLKYLLHEAGLGKELIIEEAKPSLKVAMSTPESSSFARLLIKYGAELPRKLHRYEMNPFVQDFHDRYLRSHIFGPQLKWSFNEAEYVRDFSQPRIFEGNEENGCHLIQCSNDAKKKIFGYFNCLEDIKAVLLTCKEFSELILSQEYWKAQWFATYEMAVIDDTNVLDWKQLFVAVDNLLMAEVGSGRKSKRWAIEQDCRIARVCVLKGSYCYQVRAQDGTTRTRTITPSEDDPLSHFITCELNEEINFDVEESPLPMNRIKQFLPGGQIELVDYRFTVNGNE